ncbi:NAD-dependent epimerase/dehydratase family protein [Dyella flava]|uniref:NAD(P)H-binding protein n=1 Tax=Dyella flava TaxID=1920170 RepID=A0ABS2K4P5_9GAMM|nr:NAD-dependent epimerase/dehydratase family protein [Dyella flava]MBM7126179.1 NAD(P)H-binding protein [Dyella flava]GLQ49015.1 membrane protein [Dyella flava]
MHAQNTALVIGAHGGIGSETCRALQRHGWQVRALVRHLPEDAGKDGITWIKGDAMQREDVLAASQGVELIVHAVNPPGYRNWDQLVLPMLDNTIAAARAQRARIVLPGTIYNFGPDAFPLLREDSPQRPLTRKGEIRVEMERKLAAAASHGVRTLILRCGDFFGPHAGNTWLSQGLIKAGSPVKTLHYPGDYRIGHAWAYLPDVAETIARLLDREDALADFESFHFGGYWLDGHGMLDAVRAAANNPRIAAGHFAWWLTAVLAPFVKTLREVRKMRYLWKSPIQLDDRKLIAFLGGAPYTPVEQALRATLIGIGSMPTALLPLPSGERVGVRGQSCETVACVALKHRSEDVS